MKNFLAALFLSGVSIYSSAAITTYTDRATFDSQGTIVKNSNFDDYSGSFNSPGNPFTRGDVTYTSQDNLIVGNCSYSIGCARRVMADNYWTPVTGNIATGTNMYDLFGFDVAVTSGPINMTVTTNLASYNFNGLTVSNGNPNFTFEGFQATAGEYFTNFRIDSVGAGYLVGMTDVALGNVVDANVPEPTTVALLGLGLLGVAASRRKSANSKNA